MKGEDEKMSNRIQHNRKMDFKAKYEASAEYERLRNTPTSKQIKFFKKLCMLCKENGLEIPVGQGDTRTRLEMANAIDKLIKLLNESGVDVHGNGKTAVNVITHESYGSGYRTTQRIVIQNGGNEK